MAQFLLESFVPKEDGGAVEGRTGNARRAAEEMSREGTLVRYQRSIFLPEDETCFYLFEAASAEDVAETARRAGLPFERVAEAITAAEDG